MSRYILRYTGQGAKPKRDVRQVYDHPDVEVVDESSPRMILVEGSDASCRQLAETMPDWIINEETTTPLPQPHPGAPQVRKTASEDDST